jgi:hypothetical protein
MSPFPPIFTLALRKSLSTFDSTDDAVFPEHAVNSGKLREAESGAVPG